MNYVQVVKRTAAAALAICTSLFSIVLFAPSALALIAPLGGASSAGPIQPHPEVFQAAVAGGMAGWQITLVAIGSALLSAAVVIAIDHARATRRNLALRTA